MNLLITNARVIDPSHDFDGKADILIEDGVVAEFGKKIRGSGDTLDATGLVVVPGFIDLHTHLREPGQEHKETIATGTRAAVAGGYTAVCAMANTVPPNDERAVTEMIIAEAARNGACRVYPIGAVSRGLKGEELAEFADLRSAGCVAVSDDGKPIANAQLMRRALEYAAMLQMPLVAHEEDLNLRENGVMHEGFYSTLLGMGGIPAAAEETMVARDVILAELARAHVHIAHISTAFAIDIVRNAKRGGVHVTCEATPHHIALTDEAVQSFSTNFKMNPPLRAAEHRDAVLNGIADGTIDVIATDHAPHHFDEKNVEFDLAPFGVIGLETAFSICYDRLVRKRVIDLPKLIELMSTAPARIFSLPGGTLRAGAPADITLIDLNERFQVTNTFASKASNSPFIGETLQGRVVATIVGGAMQYDLRKPAPLPKKRKRP
jgi:dihydroorotase